MWLSDDVFKQVIAHTPLISIDLIVRNAADEVLLGQRINAPAKGSWFVPGGRVRKNETLDDAFVRLLREELGIEEGITRKDAKFLGVFEHFYDDCVFGDDVSTHYIVLGYEIRPMIGLQLPQQQHFSYQLFEENTISKMDAVHQYTKNYFNENLNEV